MRPLEDHPFFCFRALKFALLRPHVTLCILNYYQTIAFLEVSQTINTWFFCSGPQKQFLRNKQIAFFHWRKWDLERKTQFKSYSTIKTLKFIKHYLYFIHGKLPLRTLPAETASASPKKNNFITVASLENCSWLRVFTVFDFVNCPPDKTSKSARWSR